MSRVKQPPPAPPASAKVLRLNVAPGKPPPPAAKRAAHGERVKRGEIPPPFEPTEQDRIVVRSGAICGMSEEEIAALVRFPEGITVETLRKHFAQDLGHGLNRAMALVATNMLKLALGTGKEAVTAGIFLLTSKAGFRNPMAKGAVVGKGGAAVPGDGTYGLPVNEDGEIVFSLKIGEARVDGPGG